MREATVPSRRSSASAVGPGAPRAALALELAADEVRVQVEEGHLLELVAHRRPRNSRVSEARVIARPPRPAMTV